MSSQQYVFHIPPFNSIDHLHLHCQVSSPSSVASYLKA
jgi:hypothetical protein